jgi:hypothetical protein
MKYIKKNRKEDEKKVVSTRIRTHIFDAFQNSTEAAKDYGYNISLADVVETALVSAIKEFTEVSGVDFLSVELDKLHKEWEEEWEKEQQEKEQKAHEEYMADYMEHETKEDEKEQKMFEEKLEKERIKQLEADQKAVLELSVSELKEYQQKRTDEEAEKKIEMEKTMKRLKDKYGDNPNPVDFSNKNED